MPKKNFFQRTMVMVKEPMNDGNKRIRRIPWDLLGREGYPFMASPTPVRVQFDGRVQTASYKPKIDDLLYEPDGDDRIDDITDIVYFDSEAHFISRFEGAFGFYLDGDKMSAEFGYPRV